MSYKQVILEFGITPADARKMSESLQKVHDNPLDANDCDADAVQYAADILAEIADKLEQ